jgi:signal transduction histidine kinase/ABC-type branched-subunit amino acid transport system ATPase component
MASTPELARLSGVCLEYGQIEALKDLSLAIHASTVHAIVGEHGAGKSSLGMVLSGNVRPQRGSIEFAGRRADPLNARAAHRLGIEMVYQHVPLNGFFTVAENIFFLDKGPGGRGLVSQRSLARRAGELLDEGGFGLDPSAEVRDLNLPDRVLVSILAALQKGPRLLILDEALEKLSSASLTKVLRILHERKTSGMAILHITHRIDDVYDMADRVSIVKNGEVLVTDEVGQIDRMNLLRMTYSQVYSLDASGNRKREFNQYLKYNEAVLLKLPVNLVVVDSEERVKIVNEPCRRYFRLEGEGFANRPLSELLGEGNGELLALIRAALGSAEGEVFYHVPLAIGGTDTVNNVRTLPIHDESRRIGSIVIIEDVSEFDKLQQQVILSEKLASVGLLAAGVAHEINNPLEIVYNYLKFLKLSRDQDELRSTVDELKEEIDYIAGIVRNLLSLSGTAQAGRELINLNEMIGSTIGLLRHSAREKGIGISFEPSAEELRVEVNRNEIKQVILNLVKNSFEAMPGGGEIRIGTSGPEREGEGRLALIEFMDNGPGIQSARLEDVFMPFYSTRRGKGDSVGLGLSICYGIVERHGGAMSVRNLEKGGCAFTISLPAAAQEA